MKCVAIVALLLAPFARVASSATPDITELAQKLKSADALDRRQAVLDLAKDATPAAWTLVIEALRDADARVADEAEIQLGDLTDPSLLKGLLTQAGLSAADPWVRARSAEALGRMKLEVDGSALCRHMHDKDAELRRLVAWSIERLARAEHLDAKSKGFAKQELETVLKKDADPSVRAAALCARNAIEPLPSAYFFEILSTKESNVVHAAATHLMASSDDGQLKTIGSLLSDEDVCVRQALMRELARDGSRDSTVSLVHYLGYEKNMRVSWTIVEYLQSLTGKMLKLELVKWKEWELSASVDWKKVGTPFAKDAKHEYDTSTAAFMDMPMLSNRIAILFEFSDTLLSKLPNGKTRKDGVEFELKHMLEHPLPNTEFNLIPYADTPVPWEKGLVPANAANIKKALGFFKDCKANGKGNIWDAMLLALSDPKVDTILVVTSGEPAGGHHWNLALIRNLVAERNRFHHVVIDALLLGAKPEVEDLWTEICAQNGGRMQRVEMK